MPLTIGVLALQGDVAEHAHMLHRIGAKPRFVKLPEQLEGLAGLILPGGESTTIGKLLVTFGLLQPLRELAHAGFPLYGTCAGMILLANRVARAGVDQPIIGGMDIEVERNAFGRQVESFEADIPLQGIAGGPFHAVFIRAPVIRSTGPQVEVLARLPDGRPVAARQENMLVSAFHPELTTDTRMHDYFLEMTKRNVPV
jgi:5'-phosphate synthase pdxT subunit